MSNDLPPIAEILVETEPEANVIERHPDGVAIVESHRENDDSPTYFVARPLPEVSEHMSFFPHRDLESARLYRDVYHDVGGFREELTGDRGIPPKVAKGKKDTIVAYLLTQDTDYEFIMDLFDIERETIHTYTSRVRSRAEERRKEMRDQ